jgi:Mycothiol maleylpyruvate isomerase N-terminal domain
VTAETVTQSRNIPRIQHDEAMAITAEENRRLGDLLVEIKPDQWSLPTDCTRWDVRAIVVHLIAGAEAQASPVEFVRQAVVGSRLTKQSAGFTRLTD